MMPSWTRKERGGDGEAERWSPRLIRRQCRHCVPSDGDTPAEPCNDHRFFKCLGCGRWRPWSKGAGDSNECDICWAANNVDDST